MTLSSSWSHHCNLIKYHSDYHSHLHISSLKKDAFFTNILVSVQSISPLDIKKSQRRMIPYRDVHIITHAKETILPSQLLLKNWFESRYQDYFGAIDQSSVKFKKNTKVQPPTGISRHYKEQNFLDQDTVNTIDRQIPPAGIRTRFYNSGDEQQSSNSASVSPNRTGGTGALSTA